MFCIPNYENMRHGNGMLHINCTAKLTVVAESIDSYLTDSGRSKEKT